MNRDQPGSTPPLGGRKKVLIADDDEDIRCVLEMVLSEDYDVSCVETGAELLAIAASTCPDVVLLDWTLPDSSGGEVVERMRALDPKLARIPIVLVSGAASVPALAARIGAIPCPKPCDIDQLVAAIERALDPARPFPPARDD